MARRQSTSDVRARRNRAPFPNPGQPVDGSFAVSLFDEDEHGAPANLAQAIERERGRLNRASAILRCLRGAMAQEPGDGSGSTDFAEATDVALRLVREAVSRLDSAVLKPFLEGRGAEAGEATGGQVKPAPQSAAEEL